MHLTQAEDPGNEQTGERGDVTIIRPWSGHKSLALSWPLYHRLPVMSASSRTFGRRDTGNGETRRMAKADEEGRRDTNLATDFDNSRRRRDASRARQISVEDLLVSEGCMGDY